MVHWTWQWKDNLSATSVTQLDLECFTLISVGDEDPKITQKMKQKYIRLTDICLYHQVLGWTGSSVQLLAATYQHRVNRTKSGTFVRHEPRYMSHSFYISVLLLIRIFCRKWKFLSLLWNFQKFCFTYYFKYKTKGKKINKHHYL